MARGNNAQKVVMVLFPCLVLLTLSFSQYAVEGIRVKSPIKTIKDESGDIFDCVGIEAQPALNNPLLKNHKIKMSPTFFPHDSKVKTKTRYGQSRALLKGIGCPQGSVPIRKTDDNVSVYALTVDSHPGKHYAGLFAKETSGKKYTGIEASLNILNPSVKGQDWSSSQIKVVGGTDDDVNKIEAGWNVAPGLYGDSKTRLFISWKGKGSQNGCFNIDPHCSGFIQVDNSIPIGRVLEVSPDSATPYELPLSIHQDLHTKDWWLVDTESYIKIGYWPKELFPHLEEGAPVVGWNGETNQGGANQPSPAMGSGKFPNGNFADSGYFAQMKVVLGSGAKIEPDPRFMEKYTDAPTCYKVLDYGNLKENGYTIMYGGPGGNWVEA